MAEKLQSLKPSRAVAPTIPSRRKKQVPKPTTDKPVKVKRERIQVKQEMTASGPFALGPARAEMGARISMTTTTVRQATATEHEDLGDGESSSSGEDEDNDLEFGPRQIKAKKAKRSKNPLDLAILRPKPEKKPSKPQPQKESTTTAKREMVIESEEDDGDVDMVVDTVDKPPQNEFLYFQFPLQMPLGTSDLPEGEIGEIQVYDSGRMTCTINHVLFDLQSTDLPDYPQEVCIIEEKEMVVLGSIGSKFVATPDIDALLDS